MHVIKKGGRVIHLMSRNPLRSVTRAEYIQGLLSEDTLNISLESKRPIEFNIGDKIEHNGRFFTLNFAPKVKREQGFYHYDLEFEGIQYQLRDKVFFNLDSTGFQTTADFPLTGGIDIFLRMLINNLNLQSSNDEMLTWRLGEFPQDTEVKTLVFNNENCLTVLQRICQEYDTEFEIVLNPSSVGGRQSVYTLNIKKIGRVLDFTFEYGKDNGLYALTRENVNNDVVTRLYAYGSTENIPTGYRNFSSRLRLPLQLDYIQDDEKVGLFGLKEAVKVFNDIKPTFKGVITGVGVFDERTKTQEITVQNMDFDLNEQKSDGSTKYLIAGTPVKLHFNKGNLAGYSFELLEKTGYNHATKTFKVIQWEDERGQKFPNPESSVFRFSVGDEFTLLDIIMPPSYIGNAEQKLLEEARKTYEKLSKNNVKYTLDIDPMWLEKTANSRQPFAIGDYVRIIDRALGVDKTSRIMSISQNLLDSFEYKLNIADDFEVNFTLSVLNDIKETQQVVKTEKIINRQKHLNSVRRMAELKDHIFDPEGYFDPQNIKPNSIETNMLSVGAKIQQFALENVTLTPNIKGNASLVKITSGNLVHYSISEDIKMWSIRERTAFRLGNFVYYVYAKVQREGLFGEWVITQERIKFNERAGYYYFLCFVLYTPRNGKREAEAMHGNVQIHGGQINAGVLRSNNGETTINLDTGEIRGNISFTAGSPALNVIDEAKQAAIRHTDTEILKTKTYADDKMNEAKRLANELDNATRNYALAQSNLAKTTAQSYADGKVTEAEQRAINEATAKMNEAKHLAQSLNNQLNETIRKINIGGRNLARNSNKFVVGVGANGISASLTPEGHLQITAMPNNGNWYAGFAYRTDGIENHFKEDEDFTFTLWIKRINGTGKPTIYIKGGMGYFHMEGEVGTDFSPIYYTGKWKKNHPIDIHLGVFSVNGSFIISCWKLEKGNRSTDWTPAPEDVEASIEFVKNLANSALGVTQAQAQNINTLMAKTNFLAQTSIQGNAVATGSLIVGNGFGANAGLTGLGGNSDIFLWGGTDFQHRNEAPISLSRDGFLRVRNGLGRVIFEIGQKNGEAVFDIYNNYGQKVAGIGQRGLEFLGYIPESYTQWNFNRLSSDWSDEQALKREITSSLRKKIVASSESASSFTNEWILYEVKNRTDVVTYLYQTGNNFETAANQKYVGYYSTNSKFGHKLPNGIYAVSTKKGVLKGNISDDNKPPDTEIGYDLQDSGYYNGDFHLNIEVYNIKDGKIIQSKIFQITSNVDYFMNE